MAQIISAQTDRRTKWNRPLVKYISRLDFSCQGLNFDDIKDSWFTDNEQWRDFDSLDVIYMYSLFDGYSDVHFWTVSIHQLMTQHETFEQTDKMSLCVRKLTIWVPTRSDTDQPVQSQK